MENVSESIMESAMECATKTKSAIEKHVGNVVEYTFVEYSFHVLTL